MTSSSVHITYDADASAPVLDGAPELADVGRFARHLVSRFVAQARSADSPGFRALVTGHLGTGVDDLPVVSESWPSYEHVNVQAAIEAPRIRTYAGTTIDIEDRVPEAVRAELTRRGHDLRLIGDWSAGGGGGQGFMVDPDSGALLGGADPRRDGYAMAF